jgi:hypothetical protein
MPELELEIGAYNVIYMLMDTDAKQFYVGQAEDLIGRLIQQHPSIPRWDYFRYDVLPPSLAPFRVALERMVIRGFAAVLKNRAGVVWRDIVGCCLVTTAWIDERRSLAPVHGPSTSQV